MIKMTGERERPKRVDYHESLDVTRNHCNSSKYKFRWHENILMFQENRSSRAFLFSISI